jgi:hypothetical protein
MSKAQARYNKRFSKFMALVAESHSRTGGIFGLMTPDAARLEVRDLIWNYDRQYDSLDEVVEKVFVLASRVAPEAAVADAQVRV